MEPKFENKYTRTPEVMKEFLLHVSLNRPIGWIILALWVETAIVNVYYWLTFESGEHLFSIVFTFCIATLILPLSVLLILKNAKIQIRRDRETNGGELVEVSVTVTDDTLTTTTPCASATVKWNDIKRVSKTKNLILLVTQTKLCYIFKKDAFTLGTEEEFSAFLRTKGFKVK